MNKNPFLVNGSFGNKRIYYRFYPKKDSRRYYFYTHGVYSSPFKKDKIAFLHKISKLGSVFCFESSRKLNFVQASDSMRYEDYIKTFKGKTFRDELKDALLAFDFFRDHLIKKDSVQEIHLIGSSLGGTIASYFLSLDERIKSITLLGSGITTKAVNMPITDTYPDKEELLKNFSKFKGRITLIQGSMDDVVPQEDARRIISESKNSEIRELIILKDVDHTFKFLKNNKSLEILNRTVYAILKNNLEI